jgi:hypothetical protein
MSLPIDPNTERYLATTDPRERRMMLKEGFIQEEEKLSLSSHELILHYLDLSTNQMATLAGLIVSLNGMVVSDFQNLDYSYSIFLCINRIEELLAVDKINLSDNECTLLTLVINIYNKVYKHPNYHISVVSMIFLLSGVLIMINCQLLGKPVPYKSIPNEQENYLTNLKNPLLRPKQSIDENLTNAIINLRCELHKWC